MDIVKQFNGFSSWLEWAAHDPETKRLLVGTGYGTYCSTMPLPDNLVKGLFDAASPGSYFNTFLRGPYDFKRLATTVPAGPQAKPVLGIPPFPPTDPWAMPPSVPAAVTVPPRGSRENPFDSGPHAIGVDNLGPGQYYLHPRALLSRPAGDMQLPNSVRLGLQELLDKVGSLHFYTTKGMVVKRVTREDDAVAGKFYVEQLVQVPGGELYVPGGGHYSFDPFLVKARDLVKVSSGMGSVVKTPPSKVFTRNHYRLVRRNEKRANNAKALQAALQKARDENRQLRAQAQTLQGRVVGRGIGHPGW